MALPVTITGIATAVATCGPFKSSGGNYYFIGRDGTTNSTLQAYKATDPTSSFSSAASKTGWGTNVLNIAVCRDGDILHVVTGNNPSSARSDYTYCQFDMSTDTWGTQEVIASNVDARTSAGTDQTGISAALRSADGQVIVYFNGARVANMGSSYSQIYHSRRTATNTWSAPVQVSAGGQVDFQTPEIVYTNSTVNRVHGFFTNLTALTSVQRTLNGSNGLETANTGITTPAVKQSVAYDDSGTMRIVAVGTSSGAAVSFYFNSAATPTINSATIQGTNVLANGVRVFLDELTVWALYGKTSDGDLYVRSSTDDGATWSAETNVFTGTVTASGDIALSIDGQIYQRGSDYVIPYIVNDNGTLKYNERVVRSAGTAHDGSSSLAGVGALAATAHKLLGAVTFPGAGALSDNTKQLMATVATLPGAGSLTDQTKQLMQAAALLAGAGAATDQTKQLMQAAAALGGAGSLTAGALKVIDALTLAGVGALTANTTHAQGIAATLAGAGSMVATAHKVINALTLAGAGSITDATKQHMTVLTTLAGAGVLVADVSPGPAVHQGEAALAGVGSMAATAHKLLGALTLAGSGALSATAHKLLGAQLLAGSGGLVATANKVIDAVTLAGAGALTSSPTQWMQVAATLAGAGAMTAQARKVIDAVTLAGVGAMTATARQRLIAAAALAGSGALASAEVQRMAVLAALAGAGSLFADADKLGAGIPLHATLNGSGSLSEASIQLLAATAGLAGAGALAGAGVMAMPTAAALEASGGLAAAASALIDALFAGAGAAEMTASSYQFLTAANDEFSGAGQLGVSATQWGGIGIDGGGVGFMRCDAFVQPAGEIIVDNTLARALPRVRTLVHHEGRDRDLQPQRYRVRSIAGR